MGDGIAKHIYESWLVEGGELAALLSDPRTNKEVMIQPDGEQWKEAINVEFTQLERLGAVLVTGGLLCDKDEDSV